MLVDSLSQVRSWRTSSLKVPPSLHTFHWEFMETINSFWGKVLKSQKDHSISMTRSYQHLLTGRARFPCFRLFSQLNLVSKLKDITYEVGREASSKQGQMDYGRHTQLWRKDWISRNSRIRDLQPANTSQRDLSFAAEKDVPAYLVNLKPTFGMSDEYSYRGYELMLIYL